IEQQLKNWLDGLFTDAQLKAKLNGDIHAWIATLQKDVNYNPNTSNHPFPVVPIGLLPAALDVMGKEYPAGPTDTAVVTFDLAHAQTANCHPDLPTLNPVSQQIPGL